MKAKDFLLTGLALAGIGATFYTALKAGEQLSVIKEDWEQATDFKGKAKASSPLILAGGCAAATGAVIVISQVKNVKALAAVSALATTGIAECNKRDISLDKILSERGIGGDKTGADCEQRPVEFNTRIFSKEDTDEIRCSTLDEPNPGDIYDTGYGTELFYESWTKRWFLSSKADVVLGLYHLNRNHALGKETTLNDYLEWLHIPADEETGDAIGWANKYLDFSQESEFIDVFGERMRFETDPKRIFTLLYFGMEPEDMEFDPTDI